MSTEQLAETGGSVSEIQSQILVLFESIENQKSNIVDAHYLDGEQSEYLEDLIAKSIKYGELCSTRDALAKEGMQAEQLSPEQISSNVKDSNAKALAEEVLFFHDLRDSDEEISDQQDVELESRWNQMIELAKGIQAT